MAWTMTMTSIIKIIHIIHNPEGVHLKSESVLIKRDIAIAYILKQQVVGNDKTSPYTIRVEYFIF